MIAMIRCEGRLLPRKELLVLLLAFGLSACGGGGSEAPKDGGGTKTGGTASTKPASANPWGGFKVGSFVKLKTTVSTQVMGKPMDTSMESKTTLAELTSDKAVLDVETSVMGNVTKTRSEIPLTGTATTTPGMPTGGAAPSVKNGTDTITVAGKTLDCKTMEFEMESGGSKINTKMWTSDQVPGFTVKSVSTSTGATSTKTTIEAVDFKAS